MAALDEPAPLTLAELAALSTQLDAHVASRKPAQVDVSAVLAAAASLVTLPPAERDRAELQAALHCLACIAALRTTAPGQAHLASDVVGRCVAIAVEVLCPRQDTSLPEPVRTRRLALMLLVNCSCWGAGARVVEASCRNTLRSVNREADDPASRSLASAALANVGQAGGLFASLTKRSAKLVPPASMLETFSRLEATLSSGVAPHAPGRLPPSPITSEQADEVMAKAEAVEAVRQAEASVEQQQQQPAEKTAPQQQPAAVKKKGKMKKEDGRNHSCSGG